eukprot:9590059-Ditylum_brightwellii.AAC.1
MTVAQHQSGRDDNTKHKQSQVQVLYEDEKIKKLTHSRLPSTEEDSKSIDDKSMHVAWHESIQEANKEEYTKYLESTYNRIEELGISDMEVDEEEEFENYMASKCNGCMNELEQDISDIVVPTANAIVSATSMMLFCLSLS